MLPTFSIICVNCTNDKQKLQHVCGLSTIKDLIERDIKFDENEQVEELKSKILMNILQNQLNLKVEDENINLLDSEIVIEF